MCMPKPPKPPKPPAIPPPPSLREEKLVAQQDDLRRRQAQSMGRSGTILTAPLGDPNAGGSTSSPSLGAGAGNAGTRIG